MGGAQTVAELLRVGAIGLVIALAVALLLAGTVVKPERRGWFVLRLVAVYAAGWTLYVLYNTVVLTRYFVRMVR